MKWNHMIWIVAIDRNFLAEWILFRPLEKSSVFDAVLRQPRCMSYGAKREVDLWAFAIDGGWAKEKKTKITNQKWEAIKWIRKQMQWNKEKKKKVMTFEMSPKGKLSPESGKVLILEVGTDPKCTRCKRSFLAISLERCLWILQSRRPPMV